MIEENGKWIMSGHETIEEAVVKDYESMCTFIKKVGFIPLFQNEIPGFSIEEHSYKYAWWGENPNIDPWALREVIASDNEIAYGKFFYGKAGFITKEWLPLFARIRRDGYDFDSRYEDGLASRRSKMVIDTLEQYEVLPSHELKKLAGFGKGGEKGFDSTMNQLQMQTYLVAAGFARKKNKKGEDYGWPGMILTLAEKKFGYDYVRSLYSMDLKEAKEKILSHINEFYDVPNEKCLNKLL